jgi:hypothetical protein
MQNIKMLYAKRQNSISTYENIPIDYYDSEVLAKKPINGKDSENVNGAQVILKRLKKGQLYIQEEQNPDLSKIYFKINSVEKVMDKSSLVKKIILEKGEIEFQIKGRQMYVYARKYSEDRTINYKVSKILRDGISVEDALKNAEAGIFNRLTEIEMEKRRREMNVGLANYRKRQLVGEVLKRTRNEIDNKTLNRAMEQLAALERVA